ncbi:hypothetical protein Cfor_10713, partial [Coptotermes formosanus]
LRRAFSMFDSSKAGKIENEKVRTILNTLGLAINDLELEALLEEEDKEEIGKLNFDSFCRVAMHFLDDEDNEVMQKELKEAFRLYDKDGNGYIPTSSLREILMALDDQLTPDQLDEMIGEIDTDGSGTVDFEVTNKEKTASAGRRRHSRCGIMRHVRVDWLWYQVVTHSQTPLVIVYGNDDWRLETTFDLYLTQAPKATCTRATPSLEKKEKEKERREEKR